MADAGNLISDIVRAADNVRCESGELRQRDNLKTLSNPEASTEKVQDRSEALSPRANARKSRAEDARGKNERSKPAKETRRSNGSSSGRVAILASSFLSSFSIEMRSLANATAVKRSARGASQRAERRRDSRARARARRRAKVKKM